MTCFIFDVKKTRDGNFFFAFQKRLVSGDRSHNSPSIQREDNNFHQKNRCLKRDMRRSRQEIRLFFMFLCSGAEKELKEIRSNRIE